MTDVHQLAIWYVTAVSSPYARASWEQAASSTTFRCRAPYVAKRCPVVVQLKYDESVEVEEVPLTEAEQARVEGGTAFEREIVSSIIDLHGTSVIVVDEGPKADRQHETLAAMASGASIVLGGWLPDDPAGRRTGLPDVLLRLEDGLGTPRREAPRRGGLRRQRFGAGLGADRTASRPSCGGGRHRALGQRVEGCPPTRPTIAGSSRLLAWHPVVPGAASSAATAESGGATWMNSGGRGALARRWRSTTVSSTSGCGSLPVRFSAMPTRGVHPLVIPLRKTECGGCSWRQVCDEELRAGDSVSLLAGVSWSAALRLTQKGVATRSDLAGLDWFTADVACGDSSSSPKVDLEEVLALSQGLPPSTELRDALGRSRRTRLTRLESRGIVTVGRPRLARAADGGGHRTPGRLICPGSSIRPVPPSPAGHCCGEDSTGSTFREPTSRSMSIWRTASRASICGG